MNNGRRPGSSRRPRGRGDKQPQNWQPSSANATDRLKRWAPASRMPSAKSQVNERRNKSALAVKEEYLGAPPEAIKQDLVEARLVFPGSHLLPRGLQAPSALDEIRKTHCVWVTFAQPNVLQIHSDSMLRLQEATQAINAAVRDMRLSSHHLATRFFVQMPTKPCNDSSIRVDVGSRAQVVGKTRPTVDISLALAAFMRQLQPHLLPSLGNLMVSDEELRMRVNFGHVEIREKEMGLGSTVNYDTFANMMAQSPVHKGASFGTKLVNIDLAEIVAQRLADPTLGICDTTYEVSRSHSLTFVMRDREFVASVSKLPGTKSQVSTGRMVEREPLASLNWIMAAPDSWLDWNIRIDSLDATGDAPPDLQALAEKFSLNLDVDQRDGVTVFTLPRLILQRPAAVNANAQISQIRLTTSVVIPCKDSPYVTDISVVQTWEGLNTTAQPTKSWRIELYGLHWDETINHVGFDEGRKDWGVGLENVWPGSGSSLESRFGDFVRNILQLQSVLDGIYAAASTA